MKPEDTNQLILTWKWYAYNLVVILREESTMEPKCFKGSWQRLGIDSRRINASRV
jgi:hypothetical protein